MRCVHFISYSFSSLSLALDSGLVPVNISLISTEKVTATVQCTGLLRHPSIHSFVHQGLPSVDVNLVGFLADSTTTEEMLSEALKKAGKDSSTTTLSVSTHRIQLDLASFTLSIQVCPSGCQSQDRNGSSDIPRSVTTRHSALSNRSTALHRARCRSPLHH